MTSLFQAQRAVNLNKIPDQNGKTFLVTGGNTGLGYEVVKALTAKNAHVFMTSRNAERQEGWVTIFQSSHLSHEAAKPSQAKLNGEAVLR